MAAPEGLFSTTQAEMEMWLDWNIKKTPEKLNTEDIMLSTNPGLTQGVTKS